MLASRSTTAWLCCDRLRREPRDGAADVVARVEAGRRCDRAGEEALAERAVGHEADAQLLARGQHLLLGTPPPQRVLALHGRHRLDRVRSSDRLGGRLGHAEVLHLAGLDEFLDRAGDVLDRHLRVDPVLVVEVDGVDAEPLQRAVDDLPDDVGLARDPPARLALDRVDVPPELGGDHDLTPERGQRLADEFLVDVRTVDLGGVEERDAAVDCGADQRDHLLPVGRVAVAAGHAHAAQPDGGDLRAAGAEGALVHGCCSCRCLPS